MANVPSSTGNETSLTPTATPHRGNRLQLNGRYIMVPNMNASALLSFTLLRRIALGNCKISYILPSIFYHVKSDNHLVDLGRMELSACGFYRTHRIFGGRDIGKNPVNLRNVGKRHHCVRVEL